MMVGPFDPQVLKKPEYSAAEDVEQEVAWRSLAAVSGNSEVAVLLRFPVADLTP